MSIQTSIGTPTATSYVSVASADEYFNSRENSDSWNDISLNTNGTASDTRKENLLKTSTREIDRTYRFQDCKYNQGIMGASDYQALDFPRSGNIDSDGDIFIPDNVKYATYEQALWVMERTGKRTSEDGETVEQSIIGMDANNYLKDWINAQVSPQGQYNWQGSDF